MTTFDQNTLVSLLSSVLIIYGGTLATAFIFAIRHIIKYNILLHDFSEAQNEIIKLKKDMNEAHNKIRSMYHIKKPE